MASASQLDLQTQTKSTIAENEPTNVPKPPKVRQKRGCNNDVETRKSQMKASEAVESRSSLAHDPKSRKKPVEAQSDACKDADGTAPSNDDMSGLFLKRHIMRKSPSI
jgi:hypothetical protein